MALRGDSLVTLMCHQCQSGSYFDSVIDADRFSLDLMRGPWVRRANVGRCRCNAGYERD